MDFKHYEEIASRVRADIVKAVQRQAPVTRADPFRPLTS